MCRVESHGECGSGLVVGHSGVEVAEGTTGAWTGANLSVGLCEGTTMGCGSRAVVSAASGVAVGPGAIALAASWVAVGPGAIALAASWVARASLSRASLLALVLAFARSRMAWLASSMAGSMVVVALW